MRVLCRIRDLSWFFNMSKVSRSLQRSPRAEWICKPRRTFFGKPVRLWEPRTQSMFVIVLGLIKLGVESWSARIQATEPTHHHGGA